MSPRKPKVKCVRCESLERPQKSKAVTFIKNAIGESIPLCSSCILEIKEEEVFISQAQEDDEPGSEGFDFELS
jgi:hypothetical protein